jgi:hypothetical protein
MLLASGRERTAVSQASAPMKAVPTMVVPSTTEAQLISLSH